MARVGIFETPPRKWLQFDKDTEFLVQYMEKGKVNTVLMQGAEAAKKMKAKAGDVQDIFLGKAALFGWRKVDDEAHPGLLTPEGEPFPFSPENRNILMTKNSRAAEFVFSACTDDRRFMDEDLPELEAAELKDLDELLEEFAKEEDPPGNV